MASIQIDQRQLRALEKKLGGLQQLHRKLRTPMAEATLLLQNKMSIDPPKQQGAFSRFATDGQRRAFWARVRRGDAKVDGRGYIRTGKTGQSWTSKVTTLSNGVVGVVGNNQQHAVYVYGAPPAPMQQKFLSTFPRVDLVFEENEKAIERIFNDFVEDELKK